MNVHLEYYRIFYYVAQEGSITAAADILNISQPAVSQSIKQLEDTLGAKLFLRMPKGMKLTAEGEALYGYVKKGYETILQGETVLNSMLNLEQGEIRIGASDMTLKYHLLPFLEAFHKEYPKVKVNVTNGPTPETIQYLKKGKIDFGIVSGPLEKMEEIDAAEVRRIQDVFVAGEHFKQLKDQVHDFSVLEKLPVICLERNTSTRKYIDSLLYNNHVILQPEFELATSDMIVQFTLRNLGVGAVVREFASEYLASGELFELKFSEPIPKRNFCIITSKKVPISKAAAKLLEMIISSKQ